MALKSFRYVSLLFIYAFIILFPFVIAFCRNVSPAYDLIYICFINSIGWTFVLILKLRQFKLGEKIVSLANEIGIETKLESIEKLALEVVKNIQRKNDSLSINLVEKQIKSKEELSRTLERIVTLAYHLLKAESAELALFNTESNFYHSSFVIGLPFGDNSQAMLAGAADGIEKDIAPNVLIQPISFAGSVMGALRVALAKDVVANHNDQEILRGIALQSGLAILNASYTEELVRMKRISDESVKVKTGFLANLSHEIRGPLGIILNADELMLDGLCGQLSPEQTETLNMIKFNGEHLLDLINDVLDYAKIESGKITPQKCQLVVDELFADIVSIMRGQADKKSHTLIFKESKEALVTLIDKRHARQILINLLTNAIKYTPDGGTIEVWAERSASNRIKINVRDTGIGIEEYSRSKVFAAFERIDNAYSIKQVGAGLGMALTKKLVEVNDGFIDFQSSVGHGTHFWVSFPAVQFDVIEHAKSNTGDIDDALSASFGEKATVLLLEENPDEREITTKYLREVGFDIIAVGTKIEALDVLRIKEIQLLILDNSLLDKADNYLEEIKAATKIKLMPIILMSSRAFSFDIEKYLKLGVDICLTKPVQLITVAKITKKLIKGEDAMTLAYEEGRRNTKKIIRSDFIK